MVIVCALFTGYCSPPSCWDQPVAPEHPTLDIVRSSISPKDVIQVGDTLHVQAVTTEPSMMYKPTAFIQGSKDLYCVDIPLRDDGEGADDVANDGKWYADIVWDQRFAVGDNVWIRISVDFQKDCFYDWEFEIYHLEVLAREKTSTPD